MKDSDSGAFGTTMHSPIRLGWFIPHGQNVHDYNRALASVWIRCLQLIEPLQTLGYQSVINRPWAPLDVAVFIRTQGAWARWLQRLLQWRGVPTVFTVVVNYYALTGNVARVRHLVSDRQIRDCVIMTREADAVVTASRFLARLAEEHNPNTLYIPDSVSRAHFRLTKPLADLDRSPLRLIWAGQSHKAGAIDEMCLGLRDLAAELTVVSNAEPALRFPYRFVQWRYETFPQEIVKGDVCIAPRVLDNSYDRGHSNFKITCFLAQGVPALVSPLESYAEAVQDGYNGFVCRTAQEWRRNLQRLIDDRGLLRRMSRNAVESAKPYLTTELLEPYDMLFRDLAERRS